MVDEKIGVAYIDDSIDNYLSRYLDEHLEEKYYEIEFDNSEQTYADLLEDSRVKDSNIVIIDSRLFENKNVDNKFSGEELGIMFNLIYPYTEVIVISQNDDFEDYGILKKYNSGGTRDKKTSDDYYNKVLLPKINDSKQKIMRKRKIIERMGGNLYEDEIFTKIQELISGNSMYRKLSNDKIDELIDLVNEALKLDGKL